MAKVIGAINMTLDGICDHTAGVPDEELHQHYVELLESAGVILYGRITYQLMQYWQTLLAKPSGEKAMDDFAIAIDKVPKVVFSRTLKNADWDTARLADGDLRIEVLALKKQSTNDILVGSRSLIIELINQAMLDEFQICIHPVLAGKGLPLFEEVNSPKTLELLKTKILGSGAIVLYYQPKTN